MSRDWRLFWRDIIEACRKIERYTSGMDRSAFEANDLVFDAVVRNLEVIGEAAKKLPSEARGLGPQVEWRKISGLRDILAHDYFGIDNDILWDVVSKEIPALRAALEGVTLS